MVRPSPLSVRPGLLLLCGAALTTVGCKDMDELVPIIPRVAACAPERTATVACTLDGDTVDVDACGADVGERIRLLGVAAPEIEHAPEPAECFGDESAAFLDDLLTGASIRLQYDQECTDIYGRSLAWIWLSGDQSDLSSDTVQLLRDLDDLGIQEDGSIELLVNELIVRAGYGELYDEGFARDVLFYEALQAAEEDAESEGRGLWTACE